MFFHHVFAKGEEISNIGTISLRARCYGRSCQATDNEDDDLAHGSFQISSKKTPILFIFNSYSQLSNPNPKRHLYLSENKRH